MFATVPLAGAPTGCTTLNGEVPEWLNGAVSKTVVGASPPRVRIPLSPPLLSMYPVRLHGFFKPRVIPYFRRWNLAIPRIPPRLAIRAPKRA